MNWKGLKWRGMNWAPMLDLDSFKEQLEAERLAAPSNPPSSLIPSNELTWKVVMEYVIESERKIFEDWIDKIWEDTKPKEREEEG